MFKHTHFSQLKYNYISLNISNAIPSSVLVPALLAIVSMFALPCLQWIFEDKDTERRSFSVGTVDIIKHLMNQEADNMKAALESMANISEAMTLLQNLELTREERRECNKLFVVCLQDWKGADKAFIWMKKNIAHETCKKIFEDHRHSGTWLETKLDEAEDCLNKSRKAFQALSFKKTCTLCQPVRGCSCCQRYCGFCRNPKTVTCDLCCCIQRCERSRFDFSALIHQFALVLATYLDLTKDVTLLMTVVSVIQVSLFFKFGTFPSTIAWILVASIFPPLLLSAIETAKNRPTSILGSSAWQRFEENPPSSCKLWCLRIFIIVFYPVIPAINICAREAAKMKKKKLLEKTREEFNKEDGIIRTEALEKLAQVEKYLLEVRTGIMTFKLNELSWEVPLQLGLQLIMLLLGTSFSATHSGLQALFQEEFQVSLNNFQPIINSDTSPRMRQTSWTGTSPRHSSFFLSSGRSGLVLQPT